MSNFEIFLMVMICAVPVVSLLMLLPKIKIKFKKKEKKVQAETKTYAEIKAEEAPAQPQTEEKPKEVKKNFSSNEISNDDFKSYLNRRKPTSRPSRLNLPEDFADRTMPYSPRRRKRADQQPKSVAEEIDNLSPELKAIIFAGVLDKKDYD